MKDKEYIELFKIWFPTKARMKPEITPEDFAKEYNNFRKRFQTQHSKLGGPVFVGSIER